MRRRELITLVGGAVAAWPFAPLAQQVTKMLRVGYITLQPKTSPDNTAFIKRMAELGYEDG